MIATANEARREGGDTLRDFVVKQLNCWIQAAGNNYIDNAEEWTAGASDRTLKDFIGSKVYAGLDLSSGGDLTSLSIVVPYYVDGEKRYYVFSHSFMPSRRLEEHIQSDDAPYDVWVRQGLITVTETMGGVKTDYRYILNYLKQLITDYDLDLQVICYDPTTLLHFWQTWRRSPLSVRNANAPGAVNPYGGPTAGDQGRACGV